MTQQSSSDPVPEGSTSLRDRKRERTRRAIIEAGIDLFTRYGYDQTTVADIAAASDIGTRTFFSYFASKEELLFPQSDARVDAALHAIAARSDNDEPAEVLIRALRDVGENDDDMVDSLAALRTRLMRTIPAVRGRSLQIQLDAERAITAALLSAYDDRLDAVEAAALVGAFIGAVSGALRVLLDHPDVGTADAESRRDALERAVGIALGRPAGRDD
jgi:AcrR family transcriptional regulator